MKGTKIGFLGYCDTPSVHKNCTGMRKIFKSGAAVYTDDIAARDVRNLKKVNRKMMDAEVSFLVLKARLHRRFLSQQLDAIFVALKLQLQNRRCKPAAICRGDIAGVSNMFET